MPLRVSTMILIRIIVLSFCIVASVSFNFESFLYHLFCGDKRSCERLQNICFAKSKAIVLIDDIPISRIDSSAHYMLYIFRDNIDST